MPTVLVSIPFVVLLAVVSLSVAFADPADNDPVSLPRESVVRIHDANSQGAGFIFHTQRHVATAFHVVAQGRPMIELRSGETIAATVVAYSVDQDIAI